MATYAFDEDIALDTVPGAELTFRAGMSHRWDTVGPPNGGFLLALAAQSLARAVPFPDPVTVTGHFLRPSRHTPVELPVEPVRAGKTHATATGRLLQDGKEILRTLATFSDLGRADGPTESGGRPPAMPPPEECLPVKELRFSAWDDLPGQLPALYRSIDVRIASTDRREEGEIARLEGWMRFTDGREPDIAALPLLADVFPPAVLDLAHWSIAETAGRRVYRGAARRVSGMLHYAWVPTVELTVHVRARPAPGWIAASFRTKFLCDGYFEEDGELWDSAGQLVALSRQLAVTRTKRPAAS